jgi:hypothetical protein
LNFFPICGSFPLSVIRCPFDELAYGLVFFNIYAVTIPLLILSPSKRRLISVSAKKPFLNEVLYCSGFFSCNNPVSRSEAAQ